MLKTLIIDIEKYNDDDLGISASSKFDIIYNFEEYKGNGDDAFLITDGRKGANISCLKGIGFALYLNANNNSESFPDALYCIENLSEIDDTVVERMFLRSKNLPWTILETDRCYLREITLDDIDAIYDIYSDEETKRYIEDLYSEKEKEIDFTKEYIAHQYRFYEYGIWVVIDKNTDRIIGRAGLSDREGYDTQEIGFVFDRKYWGKGYAFEICSAIMKYAKEELQIDRLISFTKEENKRAISLLERLGFTYIDTEKLDIGMFRMYSYSFR